MNTFSKQPAETFTIGVPFLGKLPTGTHVASGTVNAFDPAGVDVSGTVLSGTICAVVPATEEVRIRVLAGVHGTCYRIRFRVTLDSADVLEEDVAMLVENL